MSVAPRPMIPEARLRRRVRELGRAIGRDYAGRDLVVVGLLKGAFVFLADLIRAVPQPLSVEFLRASSYGPGTVSRGRPRIEGECSHPLRRRHVLVVEDIVDTGRTVAAVLARLRRSEPASLRVATLLHKPDRTEVDVRLAYVGFRIPDVFVVGYGLDHDGRWRQLPYVGVERP